MNENGCDIQMKQRGNGKNSILCLHESSHTRQRDEITHSFLKVKKYIFFFLLPRDDSEIRLVGRWRAIMYDVRIALKKDVILLPLTPRAIYLQNDLQKHRKHKVPRKR